MSILLKHGHLIVDGNREFLDGALLLEGETIKEVFPQTDKIKDLPADCEEVDLASSLVMPGFFDTHTHGIDGMSFDRADLSQMEKVAFEFGKDGTTSFLASLSYDLDPDEILEQLSVLDGCQTKASRFEGVHLEGPFLNPKKKHLQWQLESNQNFRVISTATSVTIAVDVYGAPDRT